MRSRKKVRPVRCEGFLFTVLERGHEREVQLMGSGGLIGAGLLAFVNDESSYDALGGRRRVIELAVEDALEVARGSLEIMGYLREWRGDHYEPEDRIREFTPDEILSARPILFDL